MEDVNKVVSNRQGIIFGLVLGVVSPIMQMVSKQVLLRNSIGILIAYRYAVQFVLCILQTLGMQKSFWVKSMSTMASITLVGIIHVTSSVIMYFSFELIPYADTITILYGTLTISVIVFSRIFFQDYISVCTSLISVTMIVGVVLTSQPSFIFSTISPKVHSTSITGVILAVVSAILFSSATIICRMLKDVDYSIISLQISTWGVIASSIKLATDAEFKIPTGAVEICLLVFVGILGFIILNIFVAGYKNENTTLVTLVSQVDIPLCYLSEFVVFKIVPNCLSVAGACVIVACIIILTVKDELFSQCQRVRGYENLDKIRVGGDSPTGSIC